MILLILLRVLVFLLLMVIIFYVAIQVAIQVFPTFKRWLENEELIKGVEDILADEKKKEKIAEKIKKIDRKKIQKNRDVITQFQKEAP